MSLVTGLRAERYDPAGLGCYDFKIVVKPAQNAAVLVLMYCGGASVPASRLVSSLTPPKRRARLVSP